MDHERQNGSASFQVAQKEGEKQVIYKHVSLWVGTFWRGTEHGRAGTNGASVFSSSTVSPMMAWWGE
jgi:hypothetical protein